jgi:hypothetical protein
MIVKPMPSTAAPSTAKTLRNLFLTLFLRGRTSQGIRQATAPTSIIQKLWVSLAFYGLFGSFAFFMYGQPVFILSAYLHGSTFLFLGLFLVSVAGETLFNKDEVEILMHRPISPRDLLIAKVSILVQVSLCYATALNLVGLFVGLGSRDGSWAFPFIHVISMAESAVFSAASIVLIYQVCLRLFGRERIESVMTLLQILATAAFVIGGQILPRVLANNIQFNGGAPTPMGHPAWLGYLPAGWFAGLDDAVAGSHAASSFGFAALGLAATGLVCWLAFDRLAKTYESGSQSLSESAAPSEKQLKQVRVLSRLANTSPISWWLRSSVEKVSFVLVAAYLARDREVKLRVYPSITSVLIMPIVMGLNNSSRKHMMENSLARHPGLSVHSAHLAQHMTSTFDPIFSTAGLAFGGAFLGYLPLMALSTLSYTQQWKASEVFRAAPIAGPWPLQKGARVAVISLFAIPVFIVLLGIAVAMHQIEYLPVVLPGVILTPVYGILPALLEGAVPLSRASEEAKAANRGCLLMGSTFFSFFVAGFSIFLWSLGPNWFWPFVGIETLAVVAFGYITDAHLKHVPWRTLE